MRFRWTALAIVLVLIGLMPRESTAQAKPPQTSTAKPKGGLSQNFPNPFNPNTKFGFQVGDPPACTDNKQHAVTITILDAIGRPYAYPNLLAVGAGTVAGGRPVNKLSLGCGDYTAFWDGKIIGSSRTAASGVYVYTLAIDGRVIGSKKMIVTK